MLTTPVDCGSPGCRGHPVRRRTFTPDQKLEFLAGYEKACQSGQGGAYLRREGLSSSLISEWRWLRDAGVLAGKEPGEAIGALSRNQAEIALLAAGVRNSEQFVDASAGAGVRAATGGSDLPVLDLHDVPGPGRSCGDCMGWLVSVTRKALIIRD